VLPYRAHPGDRAFLYGTLNFGRFHAGVALIPMQGLSLVILGGHHAGDSDAAVIEGGFGYGSSDGY
jgi:hypothetical protein